MYFYRSFFIQEFNFMANIIFFHKINAIKRKHIFKLKNLLLLSPKRNKNHNKRYFSETLCTKQNILYPYNGLHRIESIFEKSVLNIRITEYFLLELRELLTQLQIYFIRVIK